MYLLCYCLSISFLRTSYNYRDHIACLIDLWSYDKSLAQCVQVLNFGRFADTESLGRLLWNGEGGEVWRHTCVIFPRATRIFLLTYNTVIKDLSCPSLLLEKYSNIRKLRLITSLLRFIFYCRQHVLKHFKQLVH